MSIVNYDAPPTITKFMLDNAKVRCLVGPYASGKTTGMVMELMRRAMMEHPDAKGVRRTRFVVVRNTAQQLRQSILEEIRKWLAPAMNFRVTDSTVQFRFNHNTQGRIESDWMMIPLDKPEDQQRLLSLNITGGWVSEFREIPLPLFEALLGRCGRYVPLGVQGNAWHGLIAESNPPDEDSDWYNKLEIETPPGWKVYRQPGGLEKNAENKGPWLPANYYEDLAANNSPDWVDVHVHGKYGKSLSGQAVFRTTFKPEFHISYAGLHAIPNIPLMLAQDFGRTPAVLVTQVDNRGRLLVLDELFDLNSGIENFTITKTRPLLVSKYAGIPSFMIGDPSGEHKSQIREESPFDCLKKLGFKIYAAPTNDLDPRIRAVEELLMRQVDGGPALLIDGVACPSLVSALKFHYRFKRKQNAELDDKPEKTHPWSDLADDLQYAALGSKGNYAAKMIMRATPRPPRRVASSAGWT